MRAVAPVLSVLDQAAELSRELAEVRLLSPESATERAGAEAGLAAALHSADSAAADVVQHEATLAGLEPDPSVIEIGSAIDRLAVSVESVDVHQKDLAQANVDVMEETSRVAALARQIDPATAPDDVCACAPSPATRAGIEQKLQAAERAGQMLTQHRELVERQGDDAVESASVAVIPAESRLALQSAQLEVARNDATLKRLVALPAEIKAARRALDATLLAVRLADESMIDRIRVMLDSEIDIVTSQRDQDSTRRTGFAERIGEISGALTLETAERNRLLAAGAVPTRDEVLAARAHRDEGWHLVHDTYVTLASPDSAAYAKAMPLPQAFAQAMHHADHLIDDLARDTERATQFQACLEKIKALESDRADLDAAIAQLDREIEVQEAGWTAKLTAAGLPALAPQALREWQGGLSRASAARETLQSKLDELAQCRETEIALAGTLRQAIMGTGMGSPADHTALGTLSAMATEIEEQLKQRAREFSTAEGKRHEREQNRIRAATREKELVQNLDSSVDALGTVLSALLLPAATEVTVARARLGEFDLLVAAKAKRDAAVLNQLRAKEALERLNDQCLTVASTLGDTVPSDLRLYAERLLARLKAARQVEADRAIASQAREAALKSKRTHEDSAAMHVLVLEGLCEAAGVASKALLPHAEEQSRRKREAQVQVDQARSQLAQASRRSTEVLRTLLTGRDSASMDADEAECSRMLSLLEEELQTARRQEESARHALAAIDSADTAAVFREGMESALAGIRSSLQPWIRSRLAHALLTQALHQFRERAQAPMLVAATSYFLKMTNGEFTRLVSDDTNSQPVLMAHRQTGTPIHVDAMSEGTRDQLYLALRLAALGLRRSAGVDLPVILDDALMTSDDKRAGLILQALAEFSSGGQVIVFTHHAHLIDVAKDAVSSDALCVVQL
jgi:exonuclease SbcC